MTTVIKLRGTAAADAQTLVTLLLAEQVEVSTINGEESDRNLAQTALDFGVSLAASGTYAVVTGLVRRWLRDRRLDEADVDVSEENPTDPNSAPGD